MLIVERNRHKQIVPCRLDISERDANGIWYLYIRTGQLAGFSTPDGKAIQGLHGLGRKIRFWPEYDASKKFVGFHKSMAYM